MLFLTDPHVLQPGPCSRPHSSSSASVQLADTQLNSAVSSLLHSAHQYMAVALAPSSRSSYSSAWSTNSTFCAQNQISPTIFNQVHLLAFVAFLRDTLKPAPSTIRTHISGIQYQYCLMSITSTPMLSIPLVYMCAGMQPFSSHGAVLQGAGSPSEAYFPGLGPGLNALCRCISGSPAESEGTPGYNCSFTVHALCLACWLYPNSTLTLTGLGSSPRSSLLNISLFPGPCRYLSIPGLRSRASPLPQGRLLVTGT
ncbi:UNVERIFIED_CONTAM: hypothetical protein FKN15_059330 [Acipenser sinensis]